MRRHFFHCIGSYSCGGGCILQRCDVPADIQPSDGGQGLKGHFWKHVLVVQQAPRQLSSGLPGGRGAQAVPTVLQEQAAMLGYFFHAAHLLCVGPHPADRGSPPKRHRLPLHKEQHCSNRLTLSRLDGNSHRGLRCRIHGKLASELRRI